ncbi:MAG: hypothetical protein FJ278_22225 [Planctomycetes bacterium]|nr:hypothetical protein [Planctomycetota bacterium]
MVTIGRIRAATVDELKQVPGVSDKRAQLIFAHFHPNPPATDAQPEEAKDEQ